MEIVLPLEHAMPSKKPASNREAHVVLEFALEDNNSFSSFRANFHV